MKNGQIIQSFKENTEKERKMEEEGTIGLMELYMKDIGKIMRFMDLASMNGLMAESMLAIGRQM